MAIRGVLFDLGETLVTQEPLVGSPSNRQGAAQVAEALGRLTEVAPTAEQLTDPLGETLQEALIESYQGECAVPDARRAFLEVLDRFDIEPPSELIDLLLPLYFGPHYACMTVDPLAVRTLELLRRAGVRTAVVGNLIHGEELLVERLRAFDLLRLVDALVLSTESGWMKPHPVAYREALRRPRRPGCRRGHGGRRPGSRRARAAGAGSAGDLAAPRQRARSRVDHARRDHRRPGRPDSGHRGAGRYRDADVAG